MRIAARRVSLKPLSPGAPVRCGTVHGNRQAGFGGDIREPLQTARWSAVSPRQAALPPTLPVRHRNRHRAPGVALTDCAAGGGMRHSTSDAWLGERPDRSEMVRWLAVNAARGSEFLFRALADLLDRGSLTEAQEAAVRRCRVRALTRDARYWLPEQRKDGR